MRNTYLQLSLSFLLLFATLDRSRESPPRRSRVQRARIEINAQGYQPETVKLRRDVRARVTFVRTTDATCAKEIVLPDFGIRRALPLNQPVVVSFTPNKKGEFTFACGMNMMRGQLIVQ
ncbi:MAG: cupredoxin domain-containing protein [Pyrinomonadaceae bacterium]